MKVCRKEKNMIVWILKVLLLAYILTVLLLLGLAFLLYRMNLSEQIISAGITAIYAVSTLMGGIVIGKIAGNRRFLWGLALGISYFVILIVISLGVRHSLGGDVGRYLSTFLLCAAGGMAGGMIS